MKTKRLSALIMSAVIALTAMVSPVSAADTKYTYTLKKPVNIKNQPVVENWQQYFSIPNLYGSLKFRDANGKDITFTTPKDKELFPNFDWKTTNVMVYVTESGKLTVKENIYPLHTYSADSITKDGAKFSARKNNANSPNTCTVSKVFKIYRQGSMMGIPDYAFTMGIVLSKAEADKFLSDGTIPAVLKNADFYNPEDVGSSGAEGLREVLTGKYKAHIKKSATYKGSSTAKLKKPNDVYLEVCQYTEPNSYGALWFIDDTGHALTTTKNCPSSSYDSQLSKVTTQAFTISVTDSGTNTFAAPNHETRMYNDAKVGEGVIEFSKYKRNQGKAVAKGTFAVMTYGGDDFDYHYSLHTGVVLTTKEANDFLKTGKLPASLSSYKLYNAETGTAGSAALYEVLTGKKA